MSSMVLGDSTLESLTPSVNAPFFIIIYYRHLSEDIWKYFSDCSLKNQSYPIEGQGPGIGREAKTAKTNDKGVQCERRNFSDRQSSPSPSPKLRERSDRCFRRGWRNMRRSRLSTGFHFMPDWRSISLPRKREFVAYSSLLLLLSFDSFFVPLRAAYRCLCSLLFTVRH